jgi:hypothetical protein
MNSHFSMTEKSINPEYIGIEIHRNRQSQTIMLTQIHYLKEIINRYHMHDCTPSSIPARTHVNLSTFHLKPPDEKEISFMKSVDYRGIVAALQWLTNTRPDISAIVSILAHYVSKPRYIHYSALRTIFGYLIKHSDWGLLFNTNNSSNPDIPLLEMFCDANHAPNPDHRRSTTGTIALLHGSTISFTSKLQPTIAQSSTEAELISHNLGAKQLLTHRQFLSEIGLPQLLPTVLRADNTGAIAISENDTISRDSRHLSIKLLWLRELIASKTLSLAFCPTKDMIADILTKVLSRPLFERFRNLLGVYSLSALHTDRSSVHGGVSAVSHHVP